MGSVKDDHQDNEQSLEIFLFSNGQQDSPPRKYNVRVDNRWDTTLSLLARSQNGSNHTIELYTTDGRKIGTAQELGNGAAYVAVEPPQPFIPSGYNDYLMKASRSRDKRQEKLPKKNALVKPDKSEEQIKDGTNIKIIQDITIRSTSTMAVKEQDVSTGKNKSDTTKTAKPIGNKNNKPSQRKISVQPQPIPYTLRKNTNNVTPPVKKKYMFSKIDTTDKKVESPAFQSRKTKPIESKSKSNVAGVITMFKSNQENTDTTEAYDLLKHIDTAGETFNHVTSNKTTQNLRVDSTLIEKNILLPSFPEKDLPKSEYTVPIKLSNSKDTQAVRVYNPNGKLVPDISSRSPLTRDSLVQIKPDLNHEPDNMPQKNTLMFGNQTGDNSFTIYVKQGDVGNLILNIEVKNVSNPVLEAKHAMHENSTPSVVNTPKSDGETPKNPAGAKNYRDTLTLTEPWHPGLPYAPSEQMVNGQSAVYRCDRCSCSKTEGVGPVYVDNNNYFILVPPQELKDQILSCACRLENNDDTKDKVLTYLDLQISKNHIVKIDNDNKVSAVTNDLIKKNEDSQSKLTHYSKLEESQSLSGNRTNVHEDEDQCDCSICSVKLTTCCCADDQSEATELPAGHQEPATDFVSKEQTLVNNNPTALKEASTQTDWSGIVLEVRPTENNSYEFHIPSLKVLKMSNSLYK